MFEIMYKKTEKERFTIVNIKAENGESIDIIFEIDETGDLNIGYNTKSKVNVKIEV